MRSGGSIPDISPSAEQAPHSGEALMRSGGSVLEAPPGAAEGALPREREHEAA